MSDQTAQSIARDLMPAAPPVAVGSMTYLGIPLSQWVLIVTLVYTVAQIIIIAPKVFAVLRSWFKRE